MDERQALMWLRLCPGLNAAARHCLLRMGGCAREAVTLARRRNLAGPSRLYLQKCLDAAWVGWDDPLYPPRLRHLDDCPEVLFYRGQLQGLQQVRLAVAIVGTRRPTSTGRQLASRFARHLAGCGASVVSGLALGIDSAAHWASLDPSTGFPIAVVGCGLDYCYPAENSQLLQQIEQRGVVLSEHPPGTPPQRWHFPARNRILAALSHAILVVEAPVRSGAIITADHGLKMGREVFTLPGPMDHPNYQGNLGLIQEGAALARSPHDLIAQLCPDLIKGNYPGKPCRAQRPEQWAAELGQPLPRVLTQLTLWEMNGKMIRTAEGHFAWVDGIGNSSSRTGKPSN